MFKVEIENADGKTWFAPYEFPAAESADGMAEQLWFQHCVSGKYTAFRVIEQDGTVYSEWEI